MGPTLHSAGAGGPNSDGLSPRTYNDAEAAGSGSYDITAYNPWRAPGHAPLLDPCGVAGGWGTEVPHDARHSHRAHRSGGVLTDAGLRRQGRARQRRRAAARLQAGRARQLAAAAEGAPWRSPLPSWPSPSHGADRFPRPVAADPRRLEGGRGGHRGLGRRREPRRRLPGTPASARRSRSARRSDEVVVFILVFVTHVHTTRY